MLLCAFWAVALHVVVLVVSVCCSCDCSLPSARGRERESEWQGAGDPMKEKETQAPKARCILEECCTASSLKGQHLRGDLSARAPGLGLCAYIRQVFVYDYCSITATTSDTWHVVITLPRGFRKFCNRVPST